MPGPVHQFTYELAGSLCSATEHAIELAGTAQSSGRMPAIVTCAKDLLRREVWLAFRNDKDGSFPVVPVAALANIESGILDTDTYMHLCAGAVSASLRGMRRRAPELATDIAELAGGPRLHGHLLKPLCQGGHSVCRTSNENKDAQMSG